MKKINESKIFESRINRKVQNSFVPLLNLAKKRERLLGARIVVILSGEILRATIYTAERSIWVCRAWFISVVERFVRKSWKCYVSRR